MICLFNNVYLTYAETSVGPENTEHLSSEYIQIIDKGLLNIDHIAYSKKRLYYQKNLEDLFGTISEDEIFLELVRKSDDVYIYADEKVFSEFFIRWFKGLCPNITCETLYKVWQNYRAYESMISNKRKKFIDIGVDSKEINYRDFAHLYWDKSYDQFLGLFELYRPFKIPLEVKMSCSFEIQLLQHLMGNGHLFAASIFTRAKGLYEKKFMTEFCGLIRTLSRNILTFTEQFESITPHLSFTNQDLTKVLSDDKELKFLCDLKITPDLEGFDYLKENYNVRELCSRLLDMDYELNKKFGLTPDASRIDNPCLAFMTDNNKHPPVMDVLESELNGSSKYQIFKHLVQDNKFNIFLLHAFQNLKLLKQEEAQKIKDELFINVEGA